MAIKEIDVVGRLLVIQEYLEALPAEADVASFLRRALREVPGTAGLRICLRGALYPPVPELEAACQSFTRAIDSPASISPETIARPRNTVLLPVATLRHLYGFLAFEVLDAAAFAPYRPFIANTANTVAQVLETRDYVAEITRANAALDAMRREMEARVQERTADLARSEERVRAIADTALDAIVVIDESDAVQFWNTAAERLTGYSAREAIGRRLHSCLVPERFRIQAGEGIQHFAATGRGPIVGKVREVAATRKDGSELSIELSVAALRWDGGWGAVGIMRDISARKEAEATQARLAAIVDTAEEGIAGIDLDGTFWAWNHGGEQIYGYTAEEMIGKSTSILVPPDRRDEGRALLERVRRGESVIHMDTVRLRKDGTPITVALTLSPLRDASGAVTGASAMVHDITEHRREEERLRLANLIVENSPTLLYRTSLNADEEIAYISANVARYGYRAEDLIGKHIADFVHPEDLAVVRRIRTEIAAPVVDHALGEYRIRAADGTYRWFEGRTRPLRGPHGELIGAEGVLVDVTERKAAEEVRLQLAAVVESSRTGIITTDLDGVVTTWNEGAAKIYEYSAREMVGRPIETVGSPEPRPSIRDRLQRIERGKLPVAEEGVRITKDGRQIDVLQTLSPIYDASGNITGASAIITDISERKQAERALRRAVRALSTLSRGNEALVRAATEQGLFDEMCRAIVETGGYRMAWIGLAQDDAEKSVVPVASAGYVAGYLDAADITWSDDERGRGPTGTAIRTGAVHVNQDFAENPALAPWRAAALERGYGSSIALPLRTNAHALGALTIYAAEPDAFDAREVELLTEMASDLSFGVASLRTRADRQAAIQRLEHAMEETIQALSSTIEIRDPYTAGHQRRVADLSEAIAKEMGLAADRIHGLRLAAIVHDLGKVHIPAEILTKPGKLTPIEWELLKTHPQIGYDILKPVQFPWPIAEIVLQHHERLDGSGYPKGLKGDAILPETRILSVSDVMEAMNTHRPYRPALGVEAALAELRAGSGTRYDPAVVDALARLVTSGRVTVGTT